MSNTLYLECNSGISGDMFVAALLDLGADQHKLLEALGSIPVSGYEIQISRVSKSGLDACDFAVLLDAKHENHDHDMEYLHGEGHHHSHDHHHGHHHHHGKDQNHHHSHEHRGLAEVQHIIAHTYISDRAKAWAYKIFDILAEAEAKAHGLPKDQVHFHEVGAVDSIVDIVAAAVCLDLLDIEEAIVPYLAEGEGMIRCQHGIIPVPVPATANIAAAHNLILRPIHLQGEFVTPTGAAIAAAIQTKRRLPESYQIKAMGIGAGKRNYERPSILRAMLIQEDEDEKDVIYCLETNVDDCSGEALGYTMECLLEAGAKDVYYTPIFMKKNRPAYQLTVICDKEDIEKMEQIIFTQTTTIGIRRSRWERSVLKRTFEKVQTAYGEARIKVCEYQGNAYGYPEYSDVIRLCKQSGKSYQELYQLVIESWKAGTIQ